MVVVNINYYLLQKNLTFFSSLKVINGSLFWHATNNFSTIFSSFSRFSSAPNGTLKIFTVQEGDEGSYQCVAENDKDMSVASGSLLLGGK